MSNNQNQSQKNNHKKSLDGKKEEFSIQVEKVSETLNRNIENQNKIQKIISEYNKKFEKYYKKQQINHQKIEDNAENYFFSKDQEPERKLYFKDKNMHRKQQQDQKKQLDKQQEETCQQFYKSNIISKNKGQKYQSEQQKDSKQADNNSDKRVEKKKNNKENNEVKDDNEDDEEQIDNKNKNKNEEVDDDIDQDENDEDSGQDSDDEYEDELEKDNKKQFIPKIKQVVDKNDELDSLIPQITIQLSQLFQENLESQRDSIQFMNNYFVSLMKKWTSNAKRVIHDTKDYTKLRQTEINQEYGLNHNSSMFKVLDLEIGHTNTKINRTNVELDTSKNLYDYMQGRNEDIRYMLLHTLNQMMTQHAKSLEIWSKYDKELANVESKEMEKKTRQQIEVILKPLKENLEEKDMDEEEDDEEEDEEDEEDAENQDLYNITKNMENNNNNNDPQNQLSGLQNLHGVPEEK